MRTQAPPRAQQITSIVTMLILLIVIVTMRHKCAEGTANLFKVIEAPRDGGAQGLPDR